MSTIAKKNFLLVCLIAVATISVNVGRSNVSALAQNLLNKYAPNDIVFYNPEEGCDSDSNGMFCTTPSGENITWIGDSGSALAHDENGYDLVGRSFPGVDYGPTLNEPTSYIQSCKGVSSSCTDNNPSGLEILSKIIEEGKLREYLVFDLGANGGWSDSDMKTFLDLVGDDTKVIFVATGSDEDEYWGGINKKLRETAAAHSNIYVADMAANYKDEYFEDGEFTVEGSKVFIQTIKDTLPQNCTAGLLPGNSIAEKIWNYFVQADIEGISDNRAAIAGIIGNLYTESGLNPFMNGSTGDYYRGLYMLNSTNGSGLWSAIDSAIGASYWSFYGWWCDIGSYPDGSSCADSVLSSNNVPQDAIDTALKMELDYLALGEVNGEKVSDQTFHNEFLDFIDHFDVITYKDSARSYAELFLITVEIAYETGSVSGEAPQDPGVRSFGISRGYERWQGAESRGNNAEKFYDSFSNITSPTTTSYTGSMTSSGSNVTAASSGGYNKYDDLTDAELWDLAEVAMHENGANITAFRNEVSIIANLFEHYSDEPINGRNLWNYVGNGGWFASTTSKYVNEKHDEDVSAKYLDAARDILMEGNRTLPTQILKYDCVKCGDGVEHAYNDDNHSIDLIDNYDQWESGVTVLVQGGSDLDESWIFYGWMGGETGVGDPMGYFENNPPTDAVVSSSDQNSNCPDDSEGNGTGGAKIAEAAVRMAWPVQAGQDDDSHVGQCEESSGNWVTYTTEERPCKTNARELYHEQLLAQGRRSDGMDCGVYVGTVLQYVGAIDNITSTYDMQSDYFRPSDDWEEIKNNGVESMKPGDVLVASGSELGHSTGHIFFFVGDYGGSYGNIADASLDTRVAQVGNIYNDTVWHIWRYKRGGEESDMPIEPLYDSSVDIPCDPRTNDIGVRDDAYRNGQRFSIRLCSVPNIVDTDSPGGDGVNDGYIHVNSRVSGAFYALAEAHEKRCGGQKLTASEGYRTYDHQAMLYNSLGSAQAASPGYSNHQAGLAVDFNQSTYCSSDSSIASGGAFNLSFLEEFGFDDGRYFSVVEYWHVQPIGAD